MKKTNKNNFKLKNIIESKVIVEASNRVSIDLSNSVSYIEGIVLLRQHILGTLHTLGKPDNLIEFEVYHSLNSRDHVVFLMQPSNHYIIGYFTTEGKKKIFTPEEVSYGETVIHRFVEIKPDKKTILTLGNIIAEAVRFEPVLLHVESLIVAQKFELDVTAPLTTKNGKIWYMKRPYNDFETLEPLTLKKLRTTLISAENYWLKDPLEILMPAGYISKFKDVLQNEYVVVSDQKALFDLVSELEEIYKQRYEDKEDSDELSIEEGFLDDEDSYESSLDEDFEQWKENWRSEAEKLISAMKNQAESTYALHNRLGETAPEDPQNIRKIIPLVVTEKFSENYSTDRSFERTMISSISKIIRGDDQLHTKVFKLPPNYKLVAIPGQGHCFFSSLENQLNNKNHLSEVVVRYMREKYNKSEEELTEVWLKKTINRIQSNWDNNDIMQDIADALKLHINIYSFNNDPVCISSNAEEVTETVNIAYDDKRYYPVEIILNQHSVELEAEFLWSKFKSMLLSCIDEEEQMSCLRSEAQKKSMEASKNFLEAYYSNKGHIIESVLPNGDCFYESIARLVGQYYNYALTASDLRNKVYNYLLQNQLLIENDDLNNQTKNDYICRVKKEATATEDGTTAGKPEIRATLEVLQNLSINVSNIIIHTNTSEIDPVNTNASGAIFHLYYHNNHFMPIIENIADPIEINFNNNVIESHIDNTQATTPDEESPNATTLSDDIKILFFSHTYDNLLLNSAEMLPYVFNFAGIEAVNLFLELGYNTDLAEQILQAVDEFGIYKVLKILFGDKLKPFKSEEIPIEEQGLIVQNQDDQLLKTVVKIEAIIGKEALAELAGWYQYISKALSYNPLPKYATTVIKTISNLLNNLDEWLDFGIVLEDIDIDNQVAIILAQLENMFDFVASGITHVGLPPRYPDFDPDDYYGGGSGGGDGGSNVDESGINNIDFSSLFAGQNTNATYDL